MDPIFTVLIIVLILALFGGNFYGAGYAPYRNYGFGLGGLLVIVLVILLLTRVL